MTVPISEIVSRQRLPDCGYELSTENVRVYELS